jgi:hypothetical protein
MAALVPALVGTVLDSSRESYRKCNFSQVSTAFHSFSP